MIKIAKKANRIVLVPDDMEALWECESIIDALESNLCNGWRIIRPEEVGALTDGTIITDDWRENDHGDLIHVGMVYWDENYETQSTLETLQRGVSVSWFGRN